MRFRPNEAAWWGPPKKFDRDLEDRRVSWQELFYDLVYVIAIARITHHFAQHVSLSGFLEYTGLFVLIFWGWLNGSLYHDLHGNDGLRTRLMTLWQMMIIAAVAITVDHIPGEGYRNITIVFMIMQLYITYIWWSVGFYDKSHRRYNRPYTVLYLVSLGLMGLSLVLPATYLKFILPMVLICNYAPPFVSHSLMRRDSMDLNLSSSMFERLGLFTIIVFGEVVLGVVNGITDMQDLHFSQWINFALAIAIVFALWWIFFTLISRREARSGFRIATLFELLFIPTLLSLGLIAVSFSSFYHGHEGAYSMQSIFSFATAMFLVCVSLMMGLLEFPNTFVAIRRPARVSLVVTGMLFLGFAFLDIHVETTNYLVLVLLFLLAEISFVNFRYYRLVGKYADDQNTGSN